MNNDQEPEERQGVSSFRIADILASSPTHSSSRSGGSAVGLPTQTSPCNLSFGVERILAAQGIFGVTSAHQDFYYKLHPGYWSPAYTCYTLPGHGCEACSSQSVQLPYISTKLHETFSQYQRYSQSTAEQQPIEPLANQSKLRKPRRPWTRAVFSNLQRKGLEKRFQVQKYLTKADRHQLASMLGLSDNQVKVWFQNRRMKWRQEARESVSSTNPEGE